MVSGGSTLPRLADLALAHARPVLLVTLVVAIAAAILGAGVGDRLDPYEATDPATQSAKTTTAIEHATGLEAGVGFLVLLSAPGDGVRAGVYAPAIRARVERIVRIVRMDPAVGWVGSYLDGGGGAFVSRAGTMTYVAARFRSASPKRRQDEARSLTARLRGIAGVRLGGSAVAFAWGNRVVQEDLRRSELLALPVLMVLLLVFFGGLVAPLLPLILGGLSIVLSELALRLASDVSSISIFTLSLVSLLGLGLAIDYSLLILSRFREELRSSHGEVPVALRRTMLSAGRTVCFSAMTVAAALAVLLVFPEHYFFSMGLGGALVVLCSGACALLVLPALLALLGDRVNALALTPSWPGLHGRRRVRETADAAQTERSAGEVGEGCWYRLAMFVMRHPAPVALLATTVLIALALPFTAIKLTTTNPSTLPLSASARQVSDALERDFARDPARTALILTNNARSGQLIRYRAQLQQLPDVSHLSAPQRLSSRLTALEVTPATPALSPATGGLVRRIRGLHPPFPAGVTGETAAFLDLQSSLASHLPLALALVIAVTTIALLLMTGSVVLPLKTLLMNALTVCAAYGILVLVFQDGNLQGLLGYESPGAIDIAQPVIMLAVVLGLSTDYGVFLLDRIREYHHDGLSNEQAVALGLQRTGRIITSAALLFCVAVGSSLTSQIVEVKEVSLGVAAAILIDATIVRSLLVPALMRLLGDRNWWHPHILTNSVLSRTHIESAAPGRGRLP